MYIFWPKLFWFCSVRFLVDILENLAVCRLRRRNRELVAHYSEKEKFFCLLANVSSFSLARTHMLEISAENWKKPLITRRAPQKLRPSKKETANILHCLKFKRLANNSFSRHKSNRKKFSKQCFVCIKTLFKQDFFSKEKVL